MLSNLIRTITLAAGMAMVLVPVAPAQEIDAAAIIKAAMDP
jgi:hypothetical protein